MKIYTTWEDVCEGGVCGGELMKKLAFFCFVQKMLFQKKAEKDSKIKNIAKIMTT
jgi:hypothetical protein